MMENFDDFDHSNNLINKMTYGIANLKALMNLINLMTLYTLKILTDSAHWGESDSRHRFQAYAKNLKC